MKVYHVSDTHGDLRPLVEIPDEADIILLTGDILPTYGKLASTGRILPWAESQHQNAWLDVHWPAIHKGFQGRPCISVQGNHDFVTLNRRLYPVFELNAATPCVEIHGLLWAGFPEVPIIWDGEWNHETENMRPAIRRALQLDPDILVTHTPGTVLGDPYPCKDLGAALKRHSGRLTHHFFGHVHQSQGQQTVGRICYVNGSTVGRLHEIPEQPRPARFLTSLRGKPSK